MSRREPWTLAIKNLPGHQVLEDAAEDRQRGKLRDSSLNTFSKKKIRNIEDLGERKVLKKRRIARVVSPPSEVDELEQPRGVESPSAKKTLEVILAELPKPRRYDWRAWLKRRKFSDTARLAPL